MPPLLSVQNLTLTREGPDRWMRFPSKGQKVLDQLSFDIKKGQCFSLVGEKHSGKLPLTRALLCLHPVTSGRIEYQGENILTRSRKQLMPYRRDVQALFPDDFSPLNPLHKATHILEEPLQLHDPRLTSTEKQARLKQALQLVGLPKKTLRRWPDELDTAGRIRLSLAKALIVEPRLLICHDLTNGLDTPLQSAILNLLLDLKSTLDLTLLVVTHDLAIADHMSDSVAILHQGSIVETGCPDEIVSQPRHNYTQKLVASTLTR